MITKNLNAQIKLVATMIYKQNIGYSCWFLLLCSYYMSACYSKNNIHWIELFCQLTFP